VPGIYATGDIAYGPKLLITAVAAGQKAARSIDEYLRGVSIKTKKRGVMHAVAGQRNTVCSAIMTSSGGKSPLQ